MNPTLETFARETLKAGLAKLNGNQQLIFKRMYSHTDLDKSIVQVVDDMPIDKLDWAMTQVENTIKNHH